MRTTIKLTIAALTIGLAACTGRSNSGNSAQSSTPSAMAIDSLLARAEQLVGQTVTIEGVCTHVCRHSGRRLFLMGSDDTQTIRVEAAELGSFDKKCVNNAVRVEGTLREQRIDEAYLQQWEQQLAKQKAKQDKPQAEQTGHCATEQKAQGETANTPEGRIADFRSRIAQRLEKEGKNYLSFYFVEASAYNIEQ